MNLLIRLSPILLIFGLGHLLSRNLERRMGGMSFGKSNAKIYVPAQAGKTFDDVAGQDEAKEALKKLLIFTQSKNTRILGQSCPRALLVGPPGTGKDTFGKGCGWRSQCSLLFHLWFRICRALCRYGGFQGKGFV